MQTNRVNIKQTIQSVTIEAREKHKKSNEFEIQMRRNIVKGINQMNQDNISQAREHKIQ